MEIEIIEKNENPLLDREKIRFEVDHRNAPTPSRAEVMDGLSSELGVSEDLIVIEKVATLQGRQTASGIARVYESEDQLEKYESGHFIERTEIEEEKREEEVEEEAEEESEEKPEEEEVEKPEKEEIEEEIEEEPEEEEETEEESEEKPEEEIDYREMSDETISEIKEICEEKDVDYQELLEAEKENKDRKTLKEWLENRIE